MNLLFMPDQNVGHGPAEPSGPLLPLSMDMRLSWCSLAPRPGYTHHAATTKESRSVSSWARISMGSHGGQDSGSDAEFPGTPLEPATTYHKPASHLGLYFGI